MAVFTIGRGIVVGQLAPVVIFVATLALIVIDILGVRSRSMAFAAINAGVHAFQRVVGEVVVELNTRFEHVPIVLTVAIRAVGAKAAGVWVRMTIGTTGKLNTSKLLKVLSIARGLNVTVYTLHLAVGARKAEFGFVVVEP